MMLLTVTGMPSSSASAARTGKSRQPEVGRQHAHARLAIVEPGHRRRRALDARARHLGGAQHLGDQRAQRLHRTRGRVVDRGPAARLEDLPARVGDRDRDGVHAEVHGQVRRRVLVEVEQPRRTPAARDRRAEADLAHDAVGDQLVDDRRHRRLGQLGPARELGARDAAIAPHEIEDDRAIHLADRAVVPLARRRRRSSPRAALASRPATLRRRATRPRRTATRWGATGVVTASVACQCAIAAAA